MILHGRDRVLSGPDNRTFASVCLCGETRRAATQDTADDQLAEHITAEGQKPR